MPNRRPRLSPDQALVATTGIALTLLLVGCRHERAQKQELAPSRKDAAPIWPRREAKAKPRTMRGPPEYAPRWGFTTTVEGWPNGPNWKRIKLGDGWGCAAQRDKSFACWAAARGESEGAITAHAMASLDGREEIVVGPDRLCLPEAGGLRCWRAPESLSSFASSEGPSVLGSWFVPLDWSSHGSRTAWNFVRDRMPVTHGAQAGCATPLAAEDVRAPLFCWGTPNASADAPTCEFGPALLPCALATNKLLPDVLRVKPTYEGEPHDVLFVGDAYACKSSPHERLKCIGSTRQRWFSTGSAQGWRVWGSASPSGVCAMRKVRDSLGADPKLVPDCYGAIPRGPKDLTDIAVGLSERASACGVNEGGQLFCWGASYSSDGAGKELVPVVLSAPHTAAVWKSGRDRFHVSCQASSSCGRTQRPLPSCAIGRTPLSPAELVALAEGLEGTAVTVRGILALEPNLGIGGDVVCGPFKPNTEWEPDRARGGGDDDFCCPHRIDSPVFVTNGRARVMLDGSWCSGDSSRSCCSLPVGGQMVVATGVLAMSSTWGWTLKNPAFCEVN